MLFGKETYERVKELVADMEKATSKEKNQWLVVLAAATLAGHLINCCSEEDEKKDDINKAVSMLGRRGPCNSICQM
jgi:aspartokinase